MNTNNLREVAWIGDDFVNGPVRGLILNFHGLGDPGVKSVPTYEEQEWGEAGGLVVMPYAGPWNWMNRAARAFVDDLIGALYQQYELAPSVPLILAGGSMGGYGALLYARYTRYPVKACQALHPVCDLQFHFGERADLPRTILHALRDSPDLDAAWQEQSVLAQVAQLPRVPYQILHGTKDGAVSKQAHSDRLVGAMREHGLEVEYVEVDGMDHTAPSCFQASRRKIDFIKAMLGA